MLRKIFIMTLTMYICINILDVTGYTETVSSVTIQPGSHGHNNNAHGFTYVDLQGNPQIVHNALVTSVSENIIVFVKKEAFKPEVTIEVSKIHNPFASFSDLPWVKEILFIGNPEKRHVQIEVSGVNIEKIKCTQNTFNIIFLRNVSPNVVEIID